MYCCSVDSVTSYELGSVVAKKQDAPKFPTIRTVHEDLGKVCMSWCCCTISIGSTNTLQVQQVVINHNDQLKGLQERLDEITQWILKQSKIERVIEEWEDISGKNKQQEEAIIKILEKVNDYSALQRQHTRDLAQLKLQSSSVRSHSPNAKIKAHSANSSSTPTPVSKQQQNGDDSDDEESGKGPSAKKRKSTSGKSSAIKRARP